MNNGKTLAIALAAMVVSLHINGVAEAAAPTSEQLATIENYVIARDFDALAGYLGTFPELMEEPTSFAQELRSFVEAYAANSAFAFSPAALSAMQASLTTTAPTTAPSTAAPQATASGAASSIY